MRAKRREAVLSLSQLTWPTLSKLASSSFEGQRLSVDAALSWVSPESRENSQGFLLGEEDRGILGSGLGGIVVGWDRLSCAAPAPIEVGVGYDSGTACSGSQSR